MSVLCVDLDGTLINTDTLHEKILLFIIANPFNLLRIILWMFRGKAFLKSQLADRVHLPVSSLPYNQELLSWVKTEKASGRRVVLVTAADQKIAHAVANHLGIFDEVLASDGLTNLKSRSKASLLNKRFGEKNYTYVGNDKSDLQVWKSAKQAILVNKSRNLVKHIQRLANLQHYFVLDKLTLKAFFKAIRVHQYAKNVLLFVPLVTAHLIFDIQSWPTVLCGFMSFCCIASSVYLLNDLCDINADRQHPTKSKRAIATGLLSIKNAIFLISIFFIAAVALSWHLPSNFKIILGIYYTLTLCYSLYLKQKLLLDVITLSNLYTIRVAAGMTLLSTAVYSLWLLLFSVFLFLSLAFLKRVAELILLKEHDQTTILRRGYSTAHYPILTHFGICSGFLAILILALYLDSPTAVKLYHYPQMLILLFPVFIYWLCRIWMLAMDGKIIDDPVLFAVRDKISYVCVLIIGLVMFGASY